MNIIRRGNNLYKVDDIDRFADAEAQYPDWHIWLTDSTTLNAWLNTPGTLPSPETHK